MLVLLIIKQLFAHQIIIKMSSHFQIALHKYIVKIRAIWLVFKITMKWKLRLKRRRLVEKNIHLGNVKFSFIVYV